MGHNTKSESRFRDERSREVFRRITGNSEDRIKANWILGVMVIGFSIATVAGRAQAIAVGADGKMQQEKPAALIAPEKQSTAEQLAKLFEVMRIKQQMQSRRTMVPAMVQQQIQSAMKQSEAELPAGS